MVRAANRFAARVFSGQTLHLCCRGIEPAQVSRYVPVVLSDSEVRAIVGHLTGAPQLCVTITYGSGLRLLECLRLRVKDIDFDRRTRVAAALGR